MTASCKCENCGGTINLDEEKRTQFCPYCGAALKISENAFDHEKYMANFNEKVRQTKVKEDIEKEKREFSSVLKYLLLMFLPLLIFVIPYTAYRIEDAKLERLSNQIQSYILEGRLDEAWMETSNLRLVADWSSDATKKWDRIREDYQKVIKEKQKNAQKTCDHEWVQTGNERDSGFLLWWTHQIEFKCKKCGNTEWRDGE